MPGKGKPGTQPALPPTQPRDWSCCRVSEEHLVNLPASSTSSSACSSLSVPCLPLSSIAVTRAEGAAPTRHLVLPRSLELGASPLPKTVCAEISVWDGVGGGGTTHTSPLCPAHPESAMCIYMFARPPSPSFLLSRAIFSLALYFFLCQPPLLLCENKHCTVANSYLRALAKTRGAGRLDKTNGLFSAVSYL